MTSFVNSPLQSTSVVSACKTSQVCGQAQYSLMFCSFCAAAAAAALQAMSLSLGIHSQQPVISHNFPLFEKLTLLRKKAVIPRGENLIHFSNTRKGGGNHTHTDIVPSSKHVAAARLYLTTYFGDKTSF